MGSASRQANWESVYAAKGEAEVSWLQETSVLPSLELVRLPGGA